MSLPPPLRYLKYTNSLTFHHKLFSVNGARELWRSEGELNIQQEHPEDYFCAIYPYWMIHEWFSRKRNDRESLRIFRKKLKENTATTGVFHGDYKYCEKNTPCKCSFCGAKLRIGKLRIIMMKEFICDCLGTSSPPLIEDSAQGCRKHKAQTIASRLRKRTRK